VTPIHLIFLLILALGPSSGRADEPISVEAIAAGYFSADTYCDSGKRGWREDPRTPYTQELAFERCAHRDGRFKYVERHVQTGDYARWSDAKRYYRYIQWGGRYQALPFDDPGTFGLYRDPGQRFPVFVFEVFSRDPRNLVGSAERARYLRSYAASPALSTPQHTVFERFEANGREGERIWVLNANKSIARHETLNDGGIVRYVDVTSREVNRPLSDADLWYDTSIFARYSLMNNATVFVAALHVAAAVFGAFVWGWLLARSAAIEDVLHKRRRVWRLVLRSSGLIAVALAVLGVFMIGGSGHPPAIVYVWVIGAWCAVGFGMAVCFLLPSYPLAMLIKSRRGGTSRGP